MNKYQGFTTASETCPNRKCLAALPQFYEKAKIRLFEYQETRAREITVRPYYLDQYKMGSKGQLRNAVSYMLGKNVSINEAGEYEIGPDFSEFNKGPYLHARDMLLANRLIWC